MNLGENYYERPPKKQLFYKVFAFVMTMLGLGSYKWFDCKFSKPVACYLHAFYYVTLIAGPACILSELIYIHAHYSEIGFETHGNIFTIIPVTMLVFMKVTSAQLPAYKNLMKRFMKEIHLHNFKGEDSFMKENAIEIERYTRYLTFFFFSFLVMDWALWSILPMIVSFQHIEEIQNKSRPYQTCIYLWMPFDYEYNFNNWIIIHGLNSFLIGLGCSIVTTFDTLNYSVLFHLIGHIKSLKYRIKNKFKDNLTDEEITRNLAEIINYHCFVLQIFSNIEKAFGINVTCNYMYNLVGDSLMLYHLMVGENGNKMMYGFMLLAFMGGLILMTIVLEEVRRQTDDISEFVYNIPWEKMSTSNQKYVILMLARAQPTLEFIAAGGLKAGVNPTINIIKSTFSYYIMLNSNLWK